ncbi:MAG TPA: SIS domain-containing protein [Acidimicrobiales bacterium]|nr:SIS domain-containing protein [Acidimicrobiales bacterium]
MTDRPAPTPTGAALAAHVADSARAVASVTDQIPTIERWGAVVARSLTAGGRLLAAGNGGSAAEAQHLTAELVGRYCGERRPLSAIALHAETSTFTAVSNDYGLDAVYARQVEAHGRPGDVLVLLSTSGRSPNVVAAARTGRRLGLVVLGLTGPAPNPLADACHEAVAIDAPRTAAVQEAHLIVVHLLCAAVDAAVAEIDQRDVAGALGGRSPVEAGAR